MSLDAEEKGKLKTCPGCKASCRSMVSAAPLFVHEPGCPYVDHQYRPSLEAAIRGQRAKRAEHARSLRTPISELQELEAVRPPELDSFKPGPIDGTLVCDYCGTLIADLEKHLAWHLSLGVVRQRASAPPLIRG